MRQQLCQLDMQKVADHYIGREQTHHELRRLFEAQQIEDFVNLALGITDPRGNYSAREHEVPMGPRILSHSRPADIFELARKLDQVEKRHVPLTIHNENISYLKISIGSEMALMLRPADLWVGNKRTYWADLFVARGLRHANEMLALYYDQESDGQMDYLIWRDLYLQAENRLLELGAEAAAIATEKNITAGQLRFLWPDAVASHLFDRFAVKRRQG